MARKRHPEGMAKGERHGSAKLTAELVRALRRDAGTPEQRRARQEFGSPVKNDYSYSQLARKYGISARQAWEIVNFLSWKHIKP